MALQGLEGSSSRVTRACAAGDAEQCTLVAVRRAIRVRRGGTFGSLIVLPAGAAHAVVGCCLLQSSVGVPLKSVGVHHDSLVPRRKFFQDERALFFSRVGRPQSQQRLDVRLHLFVMQNP